MVEYITHAAKQIRTVAREVDRVKYASARNNDLIDGVINHYLSN
jgi:hypothetical protein